MRTSWLGGTRHHQVYSWPKVYHDLFDIIPRVIYLDTYISCRTPKRARRAADELEHLTLLCTSSHEKSVSKFKLFCDSFVPYFELFTERRFYRYNRKPGQWHSQTTPTSLAQGYYNRSMPKTSHFLQYTR